MIPQRRLPAYLAPFVLASPRIEHLRHSARVRTDRWDTRGRDRRNGRRCDWAYSRGANRRNVDRTAANCTYLTIYASADTCRGNLAGMSEQTRKDASETHQMAHELLHTGHWTRNSSVMVSFTAIRIRLARRCYFLRLGSAWYALSILIASSARSLSESACTSGGWRFSHPSNSFVLTVCAQVGYLR